MRAERQRRNNDLLCWVKDMCGVLYGRMDQLHLGAAYIEQKMSASSQACDAHMAPSDMTTAQRHDYGGQKQTIEQSAARQPPGRLFSFFCLPSEYRHTLY